MSATLSTPSQEDRGDFGEHMRHSFADGWQPQGRDRLTALREDAERYGPRRPCNWVRLAQLEQVLGMRAEAARDEAKGGPADQCSEFVDRFDRLASPPTRIIERGPATGPMAAPGPRQFIRR
jgi:hypothetical protein